MTILFWKLLAHKELKEQADYILNSRDTEYTLENHIISTGYNPIEKLKELEDDLDAQLLTPEIRDFIVSNVGYKEQDIFGYIKELYDLIDERFKFYGIYITNKIKDYLSHKRIDFFYVNNELNDEINEYTAKCVGKNTKELDFIN